jgi:hypothetical protein
MTNLVHLNALPCFRHVFGGLAYNRNRSSEAETAR